MDVRCRRERASALIVGATRGAACLERVPRPAGSSEVAATVGRSSIGTADRVLGHARGDDYGDAAGNPRWRREKGAPRWIT
jgi:hypothetical protein